MQERVCVPLPQATEHAPHVVQPPSTAGTVDVVHVLPLHPLLHVHCAVGNCGGAPAVMMHEAVLALGQSLHGL